MSYRPDNDDAHEGILAHLLTWLGNWPMWLAGACAAAATFAYLALR